jgi:hypothetical protein
MHAKTDNSGQFNIVVDPTGFYADHADQDLTPTMLKLRLDDACGILQHWAIESLVQAKLGMNAAEHMVALYQFPSIPMDATFENHVWVGTDGDPDTPAYMSLQLAGNTIDIYPYAVVNIIQPTTTQNPNLTYRMD